MKAAGSSSPYHNGEFETVLQVMRTMVGSNLKEEQLRQVVNRTVLFVDKVTPPLFFDCR